MSGSPSLHCLERRPAASFAEQLMLPVSNDTLLRMVRRRARVFAPEASTMLARLRQIMAEICYVHFPSGSFRLMRSLTKR